MRDFYDILSEAICENRLDDLIKESSADSYLRYSLSDIPVVLSKEAFNSLENIFNIGKIRGIEVPFAGLIDGKDEIPRILNFYKGINGTRHICYWEKGNLLENAVEKARVSGTDVSLGHSHPVFYDSHGRIERAYGAVCSMIHYTAKDLKGTDKMLNEIKKSGLYKSFGGDFCEIYLRSHKPNMSSYSWILSPRLDQAGVFKVMDSGQVEYHPWRIEK